MLIGKNLKKTRFTKMVDINQNTPVKLFKNEFGTMEVLVKICKSLNGIVDDVLEMLPTKRIDGAMRDVC